MGWLSQDDCDASSSRLLNFPRALVGFATVHRESAENTIATRELAALVSGRLGKGEQAHFWLSV